jgi:hypothetical protein
MPEAAARRTCGVPMLRPGHSADPDNGGNDGRRGRHRRCRWQEYPRQVPVAWIRSQEPMDRLTSHGSLFCRISASTILTRKSGACELSAIAPDLTQRGGGRDQLANELLTMPPPSAARVHAVTELPVRLWAVPRMPYTRPVLAATSGSAHKLPQPSCESGGTCERTGSGLTLVEGKFPFRISNSQLVGTMKERQPPRLRLGF